ncbi:MAG: hypothetical protein H6779_02880 [Candidatus Nomurabacteria bacterium]|nr:hypothetical protein [Candidatus Nomurabacteria bacterium]USN87334.1 MAG: hypothetical protein H6779_02880 [Candidatus Nomurabacteria bacterium]
MTNFIANKKYTGLLIGIGAFLLLILPTLAFAVGDGGADEKLGSSWFQDLLWGVVNGVFGFLVWMAGKLLDTAITTFVIGFGDLFINTGLGFAVDNLWQTVRDIFNLTFIFGLVYIGFKMILNVGDSSAKKMLVHIILAALLVNFSLFITKFIVDFSNIAAMQVAGAFSNGAGEYEAAGKFVERLGLTSIFDGDLTAFSSSNGNGYTYIFGTLFLFMVTAFAFFAGAILLIIRFVVLNLYMILSPIMFLGWVFPNLQRYSTEYWQNFLARAFYAPAYILMLYFAYVVFNEFSVLAKSNSFATAFASNNVATATEAFATTVPYFLIMIAFLMAAIVVGQKIGMTGGNAMVTFGKHLSGRARRAAGSVTFGITYPARAGARMAANAYGANRERRLNELQTRSGLAGTISRWNWVDRAARGGAEKLKNAELGTGTTNLKEKEYRQSTQARANQTEGELERKRQFETYNKTLDDKTKLATDLSDAFDELGKTIRKMTGIEKEKLGFEKLNNQKVAMHLSDDDISNLEKTGKFSSQQIQDIKNTRNEAYTNIATHGNVLGAGKNSTGALLYSHPNASTVDQKSSMFSKNVKDIGKMPVDVFKQQSMFDHITPAMLEERIKNGISTTDRTEIRNALSANLGIASTTVPTVALGPNNPWVKWANGNSTYAAQFFA